MFEILFEGHGGFLEIDVIDPQHHPARLDFGQVENVVDQLQQFLTAFVNYAGRFHLIGNPASAPVTLIAEGYATAATLHEETGLPAVVAFSANNLLPVAKALRKAYRAARFLVCADDDYLTDGNPGQAAASAAALAVSGAWIAPVFPGDRGGEKLTDFNDLALFPAGGPHLVRQQIFDKLAELAWPTVRAAVAQPEGDGAPLKALLSLDEANARYALVYGGKSTLFDRWEHCLVPKADVLDILPDSGWKDWKQMSGREVVRVNEVGFDPSESDPRIRCNLWAGWPTKPQAGDCDGLLSLLRGGEEEESDEASGEQEEQLEDAAGGEHAQLADVV